MNSHPTHPHQDHDPDDFESCRLLKIYPDYAGAYLWQASVCTSIIEFNGSEDLESRFEAWAYEWEKVDFLEQTIDPNDPQWRTWEECGIVLSREFRQVLSPDFTLWFYGLRTEPVQINA